MLNEICCVVSTCWYLIVVFVPLATDATTAAIKLKNLLAVKVSEDTSSSRKPRPRKRKVTSESGNLHKKAQRARIDQNKCSVCQHPFAEGEEADWVGCDFCPR